MRCDVGWTVARWKAVSGLEHCFGGRDERPPPGVATLRQVHGRRVYDVEEVRGDGFEGDGIVTSVADARVGVWTADCVPVHLVARQPRVAAALHCGWRGAAVGMIPAALEALEGSYGLLPSHLEAALGPAIGGCCYEIGAEVRDAFRSRVGTALGDAGFEERAGRLYLDLRTFLTAELAALGVVHVERIGPCTACRTDLLHSFRKEHGSGRQLSWIGWCS